MVKDFNAMSEMEKAVIYGEANTEEGFKTDFAVEGKNFSDMTVEEKGIVYMQIVSGYSEVTRDVGSYDDTTVVLSDEEYIISNTPYGYVGVSNKVSQS